VDLPEERFAFVAERLEDPLALLGAGERRVADGIALRARRERARHRQRALVEDVGGGALVGFVIGSASVASSSTRCKPAPTQPGATRSRGLGVPDGSHGRL
jgi:hypothetical protein